MNVMESILQQMPGISQPQKKFLITLFSTILLAYGKINFTNLSRYSYLSEKTYRRHFLKSFNFPQFNQYFLKEALNPEHMVIAVIDCSFLRKSGKKTDGKAYFYNGVAGKSEQGLEISVISIVEIESRLSYSLSVQQTPSRPQIKPMKKLPPNPKNSWSKNLAKNRTLKVQSLTSQELMTMHNISRILVISSPLLYVIWWLMAIIISLNSGKLYES
jgi:hypothetical protein